MRKEYVELRNGGYYLAGTRVSLDSIVRAFREGLSAETIHGEFDTLTLARVYGAIAYYLENQPFIDDYRAGQARRFASTREMAEPLPSGLRPRVSALSPGAPGSETAVSSLQRFAECDSSWRSATGTFH